MTLLNHEEGVEPTCIIRKTKPSKIWIQLHKQNKWIYVLNSEYSMNVICDQTITNIRLKGEGILQLRNKCYIKHQTMVLEATNSYNTDLNSSFSPTIDLSHQIGSNLTSPQSKHSTPPLVVQRTSTHEIEDIGERLHQSYWWLPGFA